jgi:hypothetical protein
MGLPRSPRSARVLPVPTVPWAGLVVIPFLAFHAVAHFLMADEFASQAALRDAGLRYVVLSCIAVAIGPLLPIVGAWQGLRRRRMAA